MTKRRRYSLVALCVISAALALGFSLIRGCDSRPRAPALSDEPVYVNMQEGFRFVAPEGWHIQGRGEFPQEEVTKERMLVEYRQRREGKELSLLVSMVDVAPGTPVVDYVTKRLYPRGGWKLLSFEPIRAGSLPAERLVLGAQIDKDDIIREIVAVRRNNRVYFFSGSFPAKDSKGRDEIRKAISSLTWEP
jgi:hypothetical protein